MAYTKNSQELGLIEPPLEFLKCCNISKRFCLEWKAFDIVYKMRYIYGWWRCWRSVTSPMVAILDFIKN